MKVVKTICWLSCALMLLLIIQLLNVLHVAGVSRQQLKMSQKIANVCKNNWIQHHIWIHYEKFIQMSTDMLSICLLIRKMGLEIGIFWGIFEFFWTVKPLTACYVLTSLRFPSSYTQVLLQFIHPSSSTPSERLQQLSIIKFC